MTLDDQLKFCRVCNNRKFNPELGVVCSLTQAKPSFEGNCATFSLDKPEAERLLKLEQEAKAEDITQGSSPEAAGIRKGVLGGVIMLVVAVVWFFGGLATGYVFFYPPILAVIGIYAIIKGIGTGNYTGKK
jgi:hypothetical protein